MSKVGFLRIGDMTDSLRVWWKLPELSVPTPMLHFSYHTAHKLANAEDDVCLRRQSQNLSFFVKIKLLNQDRCGYPSDARMVWYSMV